MERLKALEWDGVISMECIGAWENEQPVYKAVDAAYKGEPVTPGLLGHPAANNVVLAHQIDGLIHQQ